MSMEFISPVEITPGTANAWTDADVSGNVPAGATGVILHFSFDDTSSNYACGWRKNGSTDNRTTIVWKESHFWCACGIDASRILELYVGNTTAVDVWLVGYTTSDSVFFTNAPDKSLSTTGSWVDIDISSDTGADTAIGAFFEIIQVNYGSLDKWGFRKNGSSDSRIDGAGKHCGAVIGVDGSEICEGQVNNTNSDFFLTGYLKSGATFNTNATDLSLSTTGSYIDLDALPSGATGGFIEVMQTNFTTFHALRKNGSSEDIYYCAAGDFHSFGMVECDDSQLIEGKISITDNDFYLVGYSETGAETKTKTFSIDAILKTTFEKTFTADGVVVNRFTKAFFADSFLKKSGVKKTFSVDTILEFATSKNFSIDAILKKVFTVTVTADAFLENVFSKEFAIDAILTGGTYKTFSIDSILSTQFVRQEVDVFLRNSEVNVVMRKNSIDIKMRKNSVELIV